MKLETFLYFINGFYITTVNGNRDLARAKNRKKNYLQIRKNIV